MITSASRKPQTYRASIDGIRAIAVLSVFLFHLYPAALPGGYLGVDIFFVISGYLITGIILRENHNHTFSFAHFYSRRIKRIFPALFAVLLVSALIATFLLAPETYTNFMKSSRYASAQVANFFFAQNVGYFMEGFSGQPMLHTWSLGVEEQFYLFWPLLLFLLFAVVGKPGAAGTPDPERQRLRINRRIAVALLVLALLSFLSCSYLAGKNDRIAFYMFYTRAWEFCIGGFVSLRLVPTPVTSSRITLTELTGILFIACSLYLINENFLGVSFLQFGVILPCIGTALLLHASGPSGIVNTLLATAIPVAVGRISYSLYLVHWPLIIFYKLYSNHRELHATEALGIGAAAFLLATASYFLIEQPARKTRLPDRYVFATATVLIITFTTGFNNLEPFGAASWRISRYSDQTANQPPWYPANCRDHGKNGVNYFECKNFTDKNTPIIALTGDSHSPHFLHATVQWAAQHGYNVNYLGIPGCPMLLGDVKFKAKIDPTHTETCNRGLPFFAKKIVDDPRVKQILVAQRFDLFYDGIGFSNANRVISFLDAKGDIIKDYKTYYQNQLAHTIDLIRSKGKEVVLIKQVPLLGSIGTCEWQPRLMQWLHKERECAYDQEFIAKWQKPSIDFITDFAATHHVATIDPFPFFTSPLVDGINLYQNTDHLNPYGFQYVIPFFSKAMDSIYQKGLVRQDQTPH